MKKITFLLCLLTVTSVAFAQTVNLGLAYTGASHFDQAQVEATTALNLNLLIGLQAKMVNERAFKDPIFFTAIPVVLDFDFLRFTARPFYYFENKSDQDAYQNASAFGINTQLYLTMRNDEINDIYSHASINASFAREKGTVFFNNGSDENRYYSQAAYSLGLSHSLYNAFAIDLIGTVFQYPDGVTRVAGLRSILNQQDLSSLQTLDVVHELPKYTAGTRLTRMWSDSGSSLYVAYRYGEFHTAKPEHSILVGNSFYVAPRTSLNIAYNHVMTVHNKDRRDIWRIQIDYAF